MKQQTNNPTQTDGATRRPLIGKALGGLGRTATEHEKELSNV